MTRGLIFWIVMLLWLLSAVLTFFNLLPHGAVVNSATLFILFALLGWQTFGPPIRG